MWKNRSGPLVEVQFGAGGPFNILTLSQIRSATKREQDIKTGLVPEYD
jgi:hypothetical protein